MKRITISVEDDVFKAATEVAAQQQKSLIAVVREFIEKMSRVGKADDHLNTEDTLSEKEQKRRDVFATYFAELNARPRQEGASVGPLNREELYERGVRRF